jgi:molecular chaperone GrpE
MKDLEKLAFETPNDFEFGGKVRETVNQEKITNEQNISEPDWKDMYLRLSAEFDNFRKRALKDKEDLVIKTKSSMIEPILDLDNDLAIASKHSNDEGIKLIVSKLDKFLQAQGIQTIQTQTYDENLHEVVAVTKNGGSKIQEVVSKGYSIGDKIIRYPKVVISE